MHYFAPVDLISQRAVSLNCQPDRVCHPGGWLAAVFAVALTLSTPTQVSAVMDLAGWDFSVVSAGQASVTATSGALSGATFNSTNGGAGLLPGRSLGTLYTSGALFGPDALFPFMTFTTNATTTLNVLTVDAFVNNPTFGTLNSATFAIALSPVNAPAPGTDDRVSTLNIGGGSGYMQLGSYTATNPSSGGLVFISLNSEVMPGTYQLAFAQSGTVPSGGMTGTAQLFFTSVTLFGEVIAIPVELPGINFVSEETSLKASSPTTVASLQRRGLDRQVVIVGREIVNRVRGANMQGRRSLLGSGTTIRSGMNAGEEEDVPWSVWANVSRMKLSDDFVATSFDADFSTILFGADAFVGERLLVGALVGYERQDVETIFNRGDQDIDQYQVAAYLGYLLGDQISADVALGYTAIEIEQSRMQPLTGNVSSKVDGDRWYAAGNLNFNHIIGNSLIGASTGFLYARDQFDSFTESNGLKNPSQRTKLAQWRIGGNLAYLYWNLEFFGNAYFVYDIDSTDISVGPGQPQPPNDRSEVQLGAGIRYVGQEGVSASLEYTTVEGRTNIDSDSLSLNFRIDF